jgi:hypothetical protein
LRGKVRLSALLQELMFGYLHERGRRGSAEKLAAVLAKIPAGPPMKGDELPGKPAKPTKKRPSS